MKNEVTDQHVLKIKRKQYVVFCLLVAFFLMVLWIIIAQ
jgi:hypothetical protein